MIVRLYSGDDGKSHFEDINIGEGKDKVLPLKAGENSTIRSLEPGVFVDWHNAPQRQYVITLSGQSETTIGDGTVRKTGPGDAILAEDLTGQGHVTRITGNEPRVFMVVPLED